MLIRTTWESQHIMVFIVRTKRRIFMDNEKLRSIGDTLSISEDDIKNIKKEKRKSRFLFPIIGGIITILSTVAGYFKGKNAPPILVNRETGDVYPYAILGFAAAVGSSINPKGYQKYNKLITVTIIVTILISIIGFVTAYEFTRPVEYYEGAIMYGAFSKKR